jgi:putative endonuclease
MDDRNGLGQEGEQLAVEYLTANGFVILDRNWRCGHKEIDIVAREGNELVVVEVKTRNAPVLELPEQAINRQKRKHLVLAANAYVKINRISLDVRFDVIYVVFSGNGVGIDHTRDAFFPTLW